MKKKMNARHLLLLLTAIAGTLWAATGGEIFIRLAYVSLTVFLSAGVWSLILTRGIRFRREARLLRASVGDLFEEQFEVTVVSWPGCPWMEVINLSPLPGSAGSRVLSRVGRKEKRYYAARTLLQRRGAYPLGPTIIDAGDPFGLFPVEKRFESTETLVVLPMIFPITEFPPPPGLLPGGKAVRIRTADVTPHAAGVREYLPGDPMKRIHWPSTVKRGQFMVKEFEQDPQAQIWIFVDAQKSEHASREEVRSAVVAENWMLKKTKVSLPCDTFEYALSAAGSLAQHFLRNQRSVGLASSTARTTILSGERGERQAGKVLETLAFLEPDGTLPMRGLVSNQAKLLPAGSGVIMITPALNADIVFACEILKRKNLQPVVVHIQRESFLGGKQENEKIKNHLLGMNIPVCQVSYGDNLSKQLALPVVFFQKPYLPESYLKMRIG